MFPSVVGPLLTGVVVVGVLVPPTMLVQRHYSVTISLYTYV